MKSVFKTGLAFATAVIIISCGNDNKTETSHENHDQTTTATNDAATQPAAVRLQDDQLNAVYQHYIHLSTALANSDVAEAKAASNAIEAGARDLEGGGTIASSAAKITNASGIEAQRAAYEDLSNAMISKVKSSGVSNGEVYVQYCPMAFDDKGASWLSSNKEIRNPYFGNKMLTCGETKETIKK
jgi:hypothetical protein